MVDKRVETAKSQSLICPPTNLFLSSLDDRNIIAQTGMVYHLCANQDLFSNYKADKNKCMKISCFSKNIDDIEDPWYTGRYQKVIDEISICTDDIISYLIKEESKRDQL